MKFTHPYLLFLLWALLPLAGLLAWGILRHKKILSRFAGTAGLSLILPEFSYTRKWIRTGLILGAFGLALVALAGPRAGFRWEKTVQKGVDIMIALDCSRSMLAQDVSPTRLTRAKREIIDLTRLLRSDRAGLVAFAGNALLQCPLTLDYQAFQVFLDALDPDFLPRGGTDLTAALDTCYKGFDPRSDTQKAIILITDGEDTAGGKDPLMELVKTLAKEKVKIFAIGVGDPAGAPIPAKGGGFKKDGQGRIILSRVDESLLEKITLMTGGRYVRSEAGDMDLELIYTQDILNTMERKELSQGKKKVWEQRFQWALFPAVFLFFLALFLPDRRPSGRQPFIGSLCLILGAAVFLGTPVPARAGLFSNPVKEGIQAFGAKEFQKAKTLFIQAQLDRPRDLRLYYNIGAAAYGAGEWDLAADNFAQAAKTDDKALRQKALYNLANTRYRQGRLDAAIEQYQALLKEFPEDAQAKENLEFVRQKLEAQKKQKDKSPDKGQKGPQDSKDREKGDKDSKKSDQGQKDPKGPDKENPGQKGRNQKEQDQKDPDKNNQDSASSKNGDENQKAKGQGQDDRSGNQKEPVPQPLPDPADGRAGESPSAAVKAQAGTDADAKMLENRLNRLEDKPGMALIPSKGRGPIDKDW